MVEVEVTILYISTIIRRQLARGGTYSSPGGADALAYCTVYSPSLETLPYSLKEGFYHHSSGVQIPHLPHLPHLPCVDYCEGKDPFPPPPLLRGTSGDSPGDSPGITTHDRKSLEKNSPLFYVPWKLQRSTVLLYLFVEK